MQRLFPMTLRGSHVFDYISYLIMQRRTDEEAHGARPESPSTTAIPQTWPFRAERRLRMLGSAALYGLANRLDPGMDRSRMTPDCC
jgi:hypothetical protein